MRPSARTHAPSFGFRSSRITQRGLGLTLLWAALAACSDGLSSELAAPAGGAQTTAASGSDTAPALTIDPPSANIVFKLGEKPTLMMRALATGGGATTDVTADATWDLSSDVLGEIDTPGTASLLGVGGHGTVRVSWHGQQAAVPITLLLRDELALPGSSNAAAFAGLSPDKTEQLSVEYPDSGVVLPGNLAPITMQWAVAGDSTMYRVHFTSTDVLDVTVYTDARELAPARDLWTALAASAPDAPIGFAIAGVGPQKRLRESPPRTLMMTSDHVLATSLYAHAPTSGARHSAILDIAVGTSRPTPAEGSDLPEAGSADCVGCHDPSRDGKRTSYTRITGQTLHNGTLRMDAAGTQFQGGMAASAGPVITGVSTVFNPAEATTIPAMLATTGVRLTTQSSLALVDPDTGATVPNNLAAMIGSLGGQLASAMTPDWSADGSFVTWAAYDPAGTYSLRTGGAPSVLMEAHVGYTGSAFHFDGAHVLTKPTSGDSVFQPTIGVDDTAVAYIHSIGDDTVRALEVVRRKDQHVLPIAAGGDFPQWPVWSPSAGKKWTWLAFSSARSPGHMSPGKRLVWITAIDLEKLQTGDGDPSSPPFLAPGQNAIHVHPKWPTWVPPAK